MLSGKEDDGIQEFFIQTAFPSIRSMKEVLHAIEEAPDVGLNDLLCAVNLSYSRLQQCLKLLELDGAIVRTGQRYARHSSRSAPDLARCERVTEARRIEVEEMRDFVDSRLCLMQLVARALGDNSVQPCGRCAVCRGSLLPTRVDQNMVDQAVQFLRGCVVRLEPRAQWPAGAVRERRGRILPGLRASTGYALSVSGDSGWGMRAERDKSLLGRFADELVGACAELVTDVWRPEPRPSWVTALPSQRYPGLVPDFARRLADALHLPYVRALRKLRDTVPQSTMANSAHRLKNVAGAFGIDGEVRPEPVLLVDDTVGSRWTFTEVAYVLRGGGSGRVYPLAVVKT